jgi:hypothetical protein
MSYQVITTKRGTFGRVQVTLPMPVKDSVMKWITQSGIGKAEFLRVALMIGSKQLAESIQAKKPDEGFLNDNYSVAQETARR